VGLYPRTGGDPLSVAQMCLCVDGLLQVWGWLAGRYGWHKSCHVRSGVTQSVPKG
jgi:hypothetical protein